MEFALETFSYVGWVLLAIMILVFVHEMGHFLFAKLFGMRVDRFSVGFPPNVLKKQIGETEYVVGLTPLGGYVKISGMVDESMDTDFIASEPQPWEFRYKPVWQRVVVITAGVVFNVLLATLVYISIRYSSGETYIPAENVDAVYIEDGSLMHDIGLRTGDRVAAVNGELLDRADDIISLDALTADRLTITVERAGQEVTFEGPPDIMTRLNRTDGNFGISFYPSVIGRVAKDSPAGSVGLQRGDRIVQLDSLQIGFWNQLTNQIKTSEGKEMLIRWERPDSLYDSGAEVPAGTSLERQGGGVALFQGRITAKQVSFDGSDYFGIGIGSPDGQLLQHELGFTTRNYSLAGAIVAGGRETWVTTRAILTSLTRVVSGRDNFRETMGGPVAIARETKRAAEGGYFWRIVAMLSITLAIVNILPIPALDGGHLLFLLYEGIVRKEPSVRFRMITQQIGMLVLLAFMAFLIFNDIMRL